MRSPFDFTELQRIGRLLGSEVRHAAGDSGAHGFEKADHYGASYSHFATDLYRDIWAAAYGVDTVDNADPVAKAAKSGDQGAQRPPYRRKRDLAAAGREAIMSRSKLWPPVV